MKPKPTEPSPGTRMTDSKGVTMVYVSAGKFLMGSTQQQVNETVEQAKTERQNARKEWCADQMPQHEQVVEQGFWLDLIPVTNESYARFVAEGGYWTRDLWTPNGWEWVQNEKKTGPKDDDGFSDAQQPRVGLAWFEAYAYCR